MQPYKIDKPIRLIELFAGIGSQAMALRNLGANFTTYRTCEWWIQPNKRIPIAIRGRNPENPSDRTPGIPTIQRIEPQQENICNTLTTVNKDTMILEIVEDSVNPIRGGESRS